MKRNFLQVSVLIAYADDIVFTKNDMAEVTRLKKHLCFDFEIEDLHELSCFLGIEVARSKKEIVIWLQEYTLHELRLMPIYTLYNGRYRFVSSGVSAKSRVSFHHINQTLPKSGCAAVRLD